MLARSLTLFALALVPAALAQAPKVGEPAPPIELDAWLNVDGKPPTLAALKDRVVMLEFWGTWCGPCVEAMPEVQKLHDGYRDRGLTVLAISHESPDVMRPFLDKHAYTMPVGSDPTKKVVTAYGVRGWPTTVLIGKDGKVAWIGSPYGAITEVEKALGLEASPATLLTLYLDAAKKGDKAKHREALERLAEKATADFDLQAWARSHASPAAATEGEAAKPVPAEGEAAKPKPVEASAKLAGKPADAAVLLGRCAAAWGSDPKNAKARADALASLVAAGPTAFDLAAWSRAAFGKAFPLELKELQKLLADKKHAAAIEAIAMRNPPGPVLAAAARDADLVAYARTKGADARVAAKKGLMAQTWVFANALPRDEKVNERFWSELSVSGMATSPDKKRITGILIGGAHVSSGAVDSFVRGQLAQAIIMDDLASNKPPARVGQLSKLVEAERQKMLKPLLESYGKPEPQAAK